jgi:hypothetical protein
MKLTKNQKILLGIGVGVGLAWFFLSNGKGKKSQNNSNGVADNSTDLAKPLAKTREEKIEAILESVEATESETMTGFSGDRFEFDPTIGYAIPIGEVDIEGAGNEMIISREGNFANEIYFNADGEETDNPVEGAIAELNELTDMELDLIYACVMAKKQNPNVSISEIVAQVPVEERKKGELSTFLKKKMNDVKSIKKSPRWKMFWSNRRKDRAKFRNYFKRRNRRNDAPRGQRPFEREGKRPFGLRGNSNASGMSREVFYNQVINRN